MAASDAYAPVDAVPPPSSGVYIEISAAVSCGSEREEETARTQRTVRQAYDRHTQIEIGPAEEVAQRIAGGSNKGAAGAPTWQSCAN